MSDLFATQLHSTRTQLAPQACVLHGFALDVAGALLADVAAIEAFAPFRHLVTPGGHTMQVAMTNCGTFGWCSDRRGYRYDRRDPQTGLQWPSMPAAFLRLAADAARDAGFGGYLPDACLINRYAPGTRLSLHQDRDEADLSAPVLSVSLGDTAVFRIGPAEGGRTQSLKLASGDVCALTGPARLARHGIDRLLAGSSQLVPGGGRINLTLRRAR